MENGLVTVGEGEDAHEVYKAYVKREIARKCGILDGVFLSLNQDDILDKGLEPQAWVSFYCFGDTALTAAIEKMCHDYDAEVAHAVLIDGVSSFFICFDERERAKACVEQLEEKFSEELLFGGSLSEIIVCQLIAHDKSITLAESCTGGLIASELVRHAGISAVFKGSFVTYANEAKSRFVGVKEETLMRCGAVSSACVEEMLEGVMAQFDADVAIAVSGIAGPDGGTMEKPVGTVYVGVKNRDAEAKIKRLALHGERRYIQQGAVLWAFKLLIEENREIFFKKCLKIS